MSKSKQQYNDELFDFLHDHFKERFNELPSWQFRDNLKHLYIEILDAIQPNPFPVIQIKVYPNGKPLD